MAQKPVAVERKEGASLSVLKSQPKKDKGPTEGNLSSLKAALERVAVTAQQKSTPTREAQVPPTPKPVAPTASAPIATPVRAPLLDDAPLATPRHEVPEDVLRGLLAD